MQGGVWSDADFINGGLDICMPGQGFGGVLGLMWGDGLVANVNNGSIAESRLDDAVSVAHPFRFPSLNHLQAIRTLTPWIALGQADEPPPNVTFNADPYFFTAPDAHWRDVRAATTWRERLAHVFAPPQGPAVEWSPSAAPEPSGPR